MFNNLKERKAKADARTQLSTALNVTEVPDGLFKKCLHCQELIQSQKLIENDNVCPQCGEHSRMHIVDRIITTFDTFDMFAHTMKSEDPLDFPNYADKLNGLEKELGVHDAIVCAEATINNHEIIAMVMNPDFMMGSMGTVVGEKIVRSFERATLQHKHVVIFAASGGARMQEGIMSLMQMARTTAALSHHSEAGLLYISVLTDPTTGGVSASFAMLADIIIAEPKALIGFAGPRVIQQTMKHNLPGGFQRAEFLLEKGFLDKVVHRHEMKGMLTQILELHEVNHEKL